MALAGDHERDPARPVEDPHPLVDGAGERDEAVHLEQLLVGQPDGVAEVARLGSRGTSPPSAPPLPGQKLIDRPSTAIAASPRISEYVG